MRSKFAGRALPLLALCAAASPATAQPAPDAMAVMQAFWANTDASRFGANADLLAEDVVFIDPIWGRYEGREAASRFLASFEGAGDGCCTLDRLVAEGNVGWAFWTLHTPQGDQPWVGVYQVENGRIVFYQDIRQRIYAPEEQARHVAAFRAAQAARRDGPGED